jgi:transcriptional regulator with XRE-family HTH domain
MELSAKFGLALREARLRAGLTRTDVAKRARVSQTYVSRLELGSQKLTRESMSLLAGIVGLNVVILMMTSVSTRRAAALTTLSARSSLPRYAFLSRHSSPLILLLQLGPGRLPGSSCEIRKPDPSNEATQRFVCGPVGPVREAHGSVK